ncbi:MAG: DHH family phosphoesterase [Candidatus Omnitrophota bacterium]
MNPFKDVLNVIRDNDRFLLSTHVNPDPDALTSQLVLAEYLRRKGKRVAMINAESVPARFEFLPGSSKIKPLGDRVRLAYDAAIVTDCGDKTRVGEVGRLLRPGRPLVNIDHHVTNTAFGDVNCVLPVSSSAEIIFELLQAEKMPLDQQTAYLLYIGIMTDTGSFRYENSSARTHEIVAQLMRFDISPPQIYKKIYETIPVNDLKYFTKLVSDFEPLYDGRVVCVELSRNVVKKFSAEFDLRDKIFRYLRAIKGVEVLVILTEQDAKTTRVNFRSLGRADVARIASRFDGGGHSQASGSQLSCDMPSARRKVLRAVKKALEADVS